MAPECLAKQLYSTKSDMWAFGVLLIEIYTQAVPFPDLTPVGVANQVSRFELRPIAPSTSPEIIQDLVDKCCQFVPNERETAASVVEKLDKL
jgi:serine/threonine protein kinase